MNTKILKKKLKLGKATISNLNDSEMVVLKGGARVITEVCTQGECTTGCSQGECSYGCYTYTCYAMTCV